MTRFPWSLALAGAVFLAVTAASFWSPLKPTAWAGPREAGPFETVDPPAVGRFSRDVRLLIETIAVAWTPGRPLEATGEALVGYYALLAVARYALLWFAISRVSGRSWAASLGVLLAALPAIGFGMRHTESEVGLLFFAGLLLLTASPQVRWWIALFAIPATFSVWANAHASALVGLAWLAVLAVGRAVDWWLAYRRGDDSPPDFVWLVPSLGLSALAVCLTPDGFAIYQQAMQAMSNKALAVSPGWKELDFSKPGGLPWVYFGSIVMLGAIQLFSRRTLTASDAIVLLSFGIWPLVQSRGLEYWWLITPVLAVRFLPGPTTTPTAGEGKWIVVAILAAGVLVTPFSRWLVVGTPRHLERIVTDETPAALVRELRNGDGLPSLRGPLAAYPDGQYRGAILASEPQGDFLAWVLEGEATTPVMAYSRPVTFDPAHWADSRTALVGDPPWWDILSRHQVNLIVIDSGEHAKLAGLIRGDVQWVVLRDDGRLLIAIRRVPRLPVELMP